MEERYPYVRFVIDAGQFISGAIALIVLLAGTACSCGRGGFGGLVSFLISVVVAGIVYVAVMVQIELLRLFMDIEGATRQLAASPGATPGGTDTARSATP